MKPSKSFTIIILCLFVNQIYTQQIKWKDETTLYVTLNEDSAITMNVNSLHHSDGTSQGKDGFVYYPVNFSEEFVTELKSREIELLDTLTEKQVSITLWGTVNGTLGGGWVHFVNCILYAIETNKLKLASPLMKRPESDWKPKPMTESFKRTKNWEYYVPVSQKNAIKEYQLCKKNNELQNLAGVPANFIDIFLNTSDADYSKMKMEGRYKDVAKIDLIKLLLGSKYLGAVQIKYIENMVLQAVQLYSADLPSVIILDDYSAAVVLTLNEHGYSIENLEFRDAEYIDEQEKEARRKKIHSVIEQINEANKAVLKMRLGEYYK